MTKPVIGIDVDDVVCDKTQTVLDHMQIKYYYCKHDIPKRREEIINWNMKFTVTEGRSKRTIDLYDEIMDVYRGKETLLNFPSVIGAQPALWFLKYNYDILFITTRPPEFRDGTYEWIQKALLLKPDEFELKHVEKDKNGVGAELLVDDNIGNVYKFAKDGKPAILFDQPWNSEKIIAKNKDAWPDFRKLNIRRESSWFVICNLIYDSVIE